MEGWREEKTDGGREKLIEELLTNLFTLLPKQTFARRLISLLAGTRRFLLISQKK